MRLHLKGDLGPLQVVFITNFMKLVTTLWWTDQWGASKSRSSENETGANKTWKCTGLSCGQWYAPERLPSWTVISQHYLWYCVIITCDIIILCDYYLWYCKPQLTWFTNQHTTSKCMEILYGISARSHWYLTISSPWEKPKTFQLHCMLLFSSSLSSAFS